MTRIDLLCEFYRDTQCVMLSIPNWSYANSVCLSGVFDMTVVFNHLFFIGSQLVALSNKGKIGVWHSVTQHWQVELNTFF